MKKLFLALFLIASVHSFAQFINNQPRIFNAKHYGYKPDGTFRYNVSTTNGSATVTSSGASFSSADVGKVILVNGVGGSSNVLKTTISSVTNSTTIVLAANAQATITNDTLIYGTDNTTAIQNTISACLSNGGGKAYFGNGIAIVNGALNGTSNSQLYVSLPVDGQTKVTVDIAGESICAEGGSGYLVGFPSPNQNTGVIWYSTISGSGAAPAVISSFQTGVTTRNKTDVTIENISFWLYTNRGKNAVSMTAVNGGDFQHINCFNNIICPDIELVRCFPSPINSEVAGIVVGAIGDNGTNLLQANLIEGFKYGIVAGEHTALWGNLVYGCINGLVLPKSDHTVIGHTQIFGCVNEIYAPNYTVLSEPPGESHVQLTIESEWDTTLALISTMWYKSVNIVVDTTGYLVGTIRINNVGNGAVINTAYPYAGVDPSKLFLSTFQRNITPLYAYSTSKMRDGWNQALEIQATTNNPYPALLFSNQTSNARNAGIVATRSSSGDNLTLQQSNVQFYESSNTGVIDLRTNGNIGTTTPPTLVRVLGQTGVAIGAGGFTPTDMLSVAGNLNLTTAGNKIKITTGTNASAGTGTLSGGTVTISTTAVTASSLIFIQYTGTLTNSGQITISTKTAGTSFVVTSTNASDANTFNWWIIN